jgi:hypothetical protein
VCSRTIYEREGYLSYLVFDKPHPPARVPHCFQCETLFVKCPADFRYSCDGTYFTAADFDGDIPPGWETVIAAWKNKWRNPEDKFRRHLLTYDIKAKETTE